MTRSGELSRLLQVDAMKVWKSVAVALSACLLAVWVSSAVAASTGWRTHSARDGSLSISLPSSWLDTAQITPRLIAERHLPQQIKNTVRSMSSQPALTLAAYDLAAGKVTKRFATNLNVIENPEPAGTTVQQVEATTLGELQGSGLAVGRLRVSQLKLPAGPAYKIVGSLRLSGMVVAETQFGLVHDGIAAFVTYGTTPAASSSYSATFTRSIATLRFR
jgi:hypothetical protein